MNNTYEILSEKFGVSREVYDYVNFIEDNIDSKFFNEIEKIREINQYKVIAAFQQHKLDYTHFYWNTGYGYGDVGRDKTEAIFASYFGTEDALVRPSIASGTHALYLTMSSMVKHGDEIISITGEPYDTMLTLLGVQEDEPGNLKELGVAYREVPLINDREIDIERALTMITDKTKLLIFQRSTGYSFRPALTINKIEKAIKVLKENYPDIPIMIDNCYGEFVSTREPSNVGADLTVGSLIKNPGGGIAISGGYVVGKKKYIDRIANRLTAPGVGKEIGLTFGTTRGTLEGFFFAPHVTSEARKGALLYGSVFKNLGYEITPSLEEERSDIIQAIKFKKPEILVELCQAVQAASPVDAHVTPMAWEMPGYADQVIMASGAFVSGSSIELSADAPMRKPYIAYVQGGLFFDHSKLSVMMALERMKHLDGIEDKMKKQLAEISQDKK